MTGRREAAMHLLAAAALLFCWAANAAAPESPRATVDTTYVPPSGKTIAVQRGGDFQAALNAAKPGDVITLEANAIFTGPFTLPVKSGSEWIIVRSNAPENNLPPAGMRVDPSYAKVMPKLVARSATVITAAPGAHHYRFIGIEIHPDRPKEAWYRRALRAVVSALTGMEATAKMGFAGQNLVVLGEKETAVEQLPHHIILDRCYIHGDSIGGARRGIALNSRYTAVIDSYLSDFKEVGAEAQAILGWNGAGPFKIENNYLEGAGENVMFGGSVPTIANLVPSDIEIRRNHFHKPLSWKIGDARYDGTPWTVKNLFELKNARRVLVEGNLFEHNWVHAQNGFAILFTVRTEADAAPWAVVEDVLFTNNVLRRATAGINILGVDDSSPARNGRARRIAIRNNLFDEIGGAEWGGGGRLFQLLDGTQDVVIEHNTALQSEGIVFGGDGKAHTGFVFTNNIAPHNDYGIFGSGAGPGRPSLQRYFPGAVVSGNAIVGAPAALYPRENVFPSSLEDVGFVNRARGDYRLKDARRYRNLLRIGSLGVDFDTLEAAMGSRVADKPVIPKTN